MTVYGIKENKCFEEVISKQDFNKIRTSNNISHGTLQALNEVVSSYIRQNNNIVYAHVHEKGGDPEDPDKTYGNSAFVYDAQPERVDYKQDSLDKVGWACNCTTFVLLCLLGVPFEYSAYGKRDGYYEDNVHQMAYNYLGKAGYCFNVYGEEITADNYKKYYNTQRLYARFKELGRAEKIAYDYSNVNVGDVVWFSKGAQFTDTEDNIFKEIHHLGIVMSVLNRYKEGDDSAPVLVIAECTSASYPIKCKSYTSAKLIENSVFLVGRPVYENVTERESELLMSYDLGYSKRTIQKSFDLYNQEMVTLECDFKPTSSEQYIRIYANGNELLNRHRHQELTQPVGKFELGKTRHLIFSFPLALALDSNNLGRPDQITEIGIGCENSDSPDNLTNVRLYKGFKGSEKTYIINASTRTALKNQILSLLPTSSNRPYNGRLNICIVTSEDIEDDSANEETGQAAITLTSGARYGELYYYIGENNVEFSAILYYKGNCTNIVYKNGKVYFKNTSLI